MQDNLISQNELARRLGISRSTVTKLRKEGRIVPVFEGARLIRFDYAETVKRLRAEGVKG